MQVRNPFADLSAKLFDLLFELQNVAVPNKMRKKKKKKCYQLKKTRQQVQPHGVNKEVLNDRTKTAKLPRVRLVSGTAGTQCS
jgi:uncharacterized sporulation protein YeaH/YhbH (DUF444 family)